MPTAIPALVIALRLFMQVFMLWALRLAYAVTLGLFLRLIASKIGSVPIVGGKLKSALLAVDDTIADALGKLAQANERVLAGFLEGLGRVSDMWTEALVQQATSHYQAIDALIHGRMPDYTRTVTQPITRSIKDERVVRAARDRAQTRSIDDLGASTRARDKAEATARARGIDRLDDRIRDVVMPQIRALREQVADVRGYTARTARALSRRLSRVEALVGTGAITAGALAVMARRMPWYQCTNVKAFNRALCRAPVGALDDLLALALLSVSSLSIVELAEELQPLMEPAADAIHGWIVEN